MSRYRRTKRASEVLSYTIDWDTSNLLEDSETISTSVWVASGSGMTVESYSNTTTTSTVWLSGGTAGETYKFVNTITTSSSPQRTRIRELFVRVL